MSEKTKAELISREIDRVNLILSAKKQAAWPGGIANQTWHNYLAGLYFAKAFEEHDAAHGIVGLTVDDWRALDDRLQCARAKLYEALRK